jgi:hypothetical protein
MAGGRCEQASQLLVLSPAPVGSPWQQTPGPARQPQPCAGALTHAGYQGEQGGQGHQGSLPGERLVAQHGWQRGGSRVAHQLGGCGQARHRGSTGVQEGGVGWAGAQARIAGDARSGWGRAGRARTVLEQTRQRQGGSWRRHPPPPKQQAQGGAGARVSKRLDDPTPAITQQRRGRGAHLLQSATWRATCPPALHSSGRQPPCSSPLQRSGVRWPGWPGGRRGAQKPYPAHLGVRAGRGARPGARLPAAWLPVRVDSCQPK